MKKHLLLFALFLFLITQAKAQTSVYHPFPDSNAYWNEGTFYSPDGVSTVNTIYSIFINEDTIIGGNIYHKLFKSGYQFVDYSYDVTSYFSNQYIGALREDTVSRKVFFVPWIYSSDTLLYDFNLSLDSFLPKTYINNPIRGNYVSSIDSILIGSSYRKRFWISVFGGQGELGYDSNYVALIEGIGSTFGLENGMFPYFEAGAALGCFSQNGLTLYLGRGGDSCIIQTAIKESSSQNIISLSPNPATNQLTIHTSSFHNEAVMVSIMNVMGQDVSTSLNVPGSLSEVEVDVSKLAAGMYFLQLNWESGSVVKKFVKE